jgi:hypothetical protein
MIATGAYPPLIPHAFWPQLARPPSGEWGPHTSCGPWVDRDDREHEEGSMRLVSERPAVEDA